MCIRDSLIPKSPVPARITVFLDFKDTNIHLGNFRKIIAFPESVVSELPRHPQWRPGVEKIDLEAVSYTHLRAHETVLDLVCRLLLEKKKKKKTQRKKKKNRQKLKLKL